MVFSQNGPTSIEQSGKDLYREAWAYVFVLDCVSPRVSDRSLQNNLKSYANQINKAQKNLKDSKFSHNIYFSDLEEELSEARELIKNHFPVQAEVFASVINPLKTAKPEEEKAIKSFLDAYTDVNTDKRIIDHNRPGTCGQNFWQRAWNFIAVHILGTAVVIAKIEGLPNLDPPSTQDKQPGNEGGLVGAANPVKSGEFKGGLAAFSGGDCVSYQHVRKEREVYGFNKEVHEKMKQYTQAVLKGEDTGDADDRTADVATPC